MPSNSKLTPEQKTFRKELMAQLPAGSQFAVSESGATYLTVPDGQFNMLTSAFMSPDETKFRRKVGEYHALMRWAEGFTALVPRSFEAEDMVSAAGEDVRSNSEGFPMIRWI